MAFQISLIPALGDNYVYLVSDAQLGLAMVVDPGVADGVIKSLNDNDLHLALILITHHHSDHVGGNDKLVRTYGAPVIGPAKERNRIEGMARGVGEGDMVTFSNLKGRVIETPGHTSGHIVYYFEQLKALFAGDTLFSLGCGKLFEGTASEMWKSLQEIKKLPDDTLLYCGHEYTEKNGQFALAIDRNNEMLKSRVAEASAQRRLGKPTLPVTLGVEKMTNPFLRVDDPAFQKILKKSGLPGAEGSDPAAIFGALRVAKDRFG